MRAKIYIRQWLIEKGFSGEGVPPELSEEIRITLAERYVELYHTLTGKFFNPIVGDVKSRIINNLEIAGYTV